MKGHGTSVIPITSGFRKDMEKLLKLYKDQNSLDYRSFAECFRSMQFASVFTGRLSSAELVEFTEKILQMAISYAMTYRNREMLSSYVEGDESNDKSLSQTNEENSLQERMFGIYLAYSLYYAQPNNYVSQIRLTPAQMGDLESFMTGVLVPEKHLDPLYALYRLINEGGFRIVAFDKEFNPCLHKRYDRAELDEGDSDSNTEEVSFLKAVLDCDELRLADNIHYKYEEAKKRAGFAPGMQIIKQSISEMINEVLRRTESLTGTSVSKMEPNEKAGSSKAAIIKQNAYKSRAVHPKRRRHRLSSSREGIEQTLSQPGPSGLNRQTSVKRSSKKQRTQAENNGTEKVTEGDAVEAANVEGKRRAVKRNKECKQSLHEAQKKAGRDKEGSPTNKVTPPEAKKAKKASLAGKKTPKCEPRSEMSVPENVISSRGRINEVIDEQHADKIFEQLQRNMNT